MKIRAKVVDSTIVAHDGHLKAFWERVRLLHNGGIEISVRALKSNRSISQNAYYWGLVLPCLASGFYDLHGEHYSVEDIHEFFKGKFLASREIVDPETGELVSVKGSTARLYKDEFGDYLDQVIRWAAEYLSMSIPEAS